MLPFNEGSNGHREFFLDSDMREKKYGYLGNN